MDQKTPVVLLHAYPLKAEMWDDLVKGLEGREVIAPDFPGFGGRPAGATTLDGFAEQIINDMDEAKIERAVIVGLSMGGYVAFRLFDKWPERVAALVLADTKAVPDDEGAAAKRTGQAARLRREGINWLPNAMVPDLVASSTAKNKPEVVERIRGWINGADPEGVARALLAIRNRPDSTDLLARIDVPVLVLVGADDKVTPLAEAQRIATGVQNGRIVVLPDAGHLSNLESPEAFTAAVSEFVDSV